MGLGATQVEVKVKVKVKVKKDRKTSGLQDRKTIIPLEGNYFLTLNHGKKK